MIKAIVATSVLVVFTTPAAAAAILTSAGQAELHPIVAPTARPNVTTTDQWTCVTESVKERYFNGPKPSGSLDISMISYGSELIETCKTSGAYPYPCPSRTRPVGAASPQRYRPRSSRPIRGLPDSLVRGVQLCVFGGAIWLNHTLIDGECYAEANPTSASKSGPTATPGQGATPSGSTPTSTPTRSAPNGVAGRAENGHIWVAAAPGLAAALAM